MYLPPMGEQLYITTLKTGFVIQCKICEKSKYRFLLKNSQKSMIRQKIKRHDCWQALGQSLFDRIH